MRNYNVSVMSSTMKAFAWLQTWVQLELAPALGLEPRLLAVGILRGVYDTLLLVLLGLGLLTGGSLYMRGQYALPNSVQLMAVKWAPVANAIGRQVDIPREVPLVLWFKENSMRAENPANCVGIMGTYDLVRSGERPCFTPGPISDLEVREQLLIGAQEFKKRCPEITYQTQSPNTLKRCYLAYNAGTGAANRLNPEQSAYVMNNYNAAYQNMVYSDVELGTVRVTSLGAWPTHLAVQSLIISQLDEEERPLSIALLDASTRITDSLYEKLITWRWETSDDNQQLQFSQTRNLEHQTCLASPHLLGRPSLRPRFNPIAENPILTQDVHGCSYNLPGIDISSENSTALLQAPMPGEVTTYTDRWYNSTIRIENEEWIIWLLHPRSYIVKEGFVEIGQAVGVMGAVGFATGPHVHYSIYDKINETFVDPRHFLP